MKAWQIEKTLEALAPKETALSFDNVGFLVGDPQKDIKRVFLTLDISPETVEEAKMQGADMIVSHHPVIFTPFRHITPEKYDMAAVSAILGEGLCAICMHTNLDLAKGGVNDALAKALILENIEKVDGDEIGLLRTGYLPEETDMLSFSRHVKDALSCPGLWYQDAGKPVRKVAVCGGAGGSDDELALALACGADVYVSSEFHHHITLQAKYRGISLVDAGHFYTEQPVISALWNYLSEKLPELTLSRSSVLPAGRFLA